MKTKQKKYVIKHRIDFVGNKLPLYIRDEGGIVLCFQLPNRYEGQSERYKFEVEEVIKLADFILHKLNTEFESLEDKLEKRKKRFQGWSASDYELDGNEE